MIRIAAHAVLFTDKIVSETDSILNKFHDMGYEGIEIGSRFFPQEKMAILKDKLLNSDMELSGMHALIFFDQLLENFTEVKKNILTMAEMMEQNGFKRIIASGIPDSSGADNMEEKMLNYSKEELQQIQLKLDEIAYELKEQTNIQLFYHNHNWELSGTNFLLELLEQSEHLKFAMDMGWISVEEYNPAEMIEKYSDKFGYLHLRDCLSEMYVGKNLDFQEKSESFLDVGEGDVNFAKIIEAFGKTTVEDEKWVVIEYEKGAIDFERYARAFEIIEPLIKGAYVK